MGHESLGSSYELLPEILLDDRRPQTAASPTGVAHLPSQRSPYAPATVPDHAATWRHYPGPAVPVESPAAVVSLVPGALGYLPRQRQAPPTGPQYGVCYWCRRPRIAVVLDRGGRGRPPHIVLACEHCR